MGHRHPRTRLLHLPHRIGRNLLLSRGYKENGGIFCHNNPWISIANAIAGNDDEAFAVYQRNCPAYVEDKSDVRKVEPYVYCQMVAGPEAATPGEARTPG